MPPDLGIRVRLFAIQRELVGSREVAIRIPPGATVDAAWDELVGRYPILAPGRASVRFARNGEYADPAMTLEDGDELAIIPPVSGGADEGDGPPIRIIELRERAFEPDLIAVLTGRLVTAGDGAVVGFVGRTRATPGTPAPGQEAAATRHAGRSVVSLEYEAHEPMAVATLAKIADEIAERFGVVRLAIVHRTGEVPLGESSVAVVAVAAHRDAAFEAAHYAIDETKARAPIWKAEHFADGHVWIGQPARTESPIERPRPQPRETS